LAVNRSCDGHPTSDKSSSRIAIIASALASPVRQDKPGPSSSLRGDCHVSADDTCSCGLSRGGNEARGARPVRGGHRAKRPKAVDSEAVSRKPSKVEPGSASLRKVQVAKLPDKLKPARAGKTSAYAPERPAGVGADGAQ
jgi:hypothetical protein